MKLKSAHVINRFQFAFIERFAGTFSDLVEILADTDVISADRLRRVSSSWQEDLRFLS